MQWLCIIPCWWFCIITDYFLYSLLLTYMHIKAEPSRTTFDIQEGAGCQESLRWIYTWLRPPFLQVIDCCCRWTSVGVGWGVLFVCVRERDHQCWLVYHSMTMETQVSDEKSLSSKLKNENFIIRNKALHLSYKYFLFPFELWIIRSKDRKWKTSEIIKEICNFYTSTLLYFFMAQCFINSAQGMTFFLPAVKVTHNSNSMKQSPSEANSCSVSQIPRILWNLKVHRHVRNSPPLVPSWVRWVQSTASHPLS
jgi:hypothetical protein